MTGDDVQALTDKIAALEAVENAEQWTRVPGKERIYIELMRVDKNHKRFGGSGGRIYFDLNAAKVITHRRGYGHTPFYNSYTFSFHTEKNTISAIQEIVDAFACK